MTATRKEHHMTDQTAHPLDNIPALSDEDIQAWIAQRVLRTQ
jgi:hypothetical protein